MLPKALRAVVLQVANEFDSRLNRVEASELDPPSDVRPPLRAHERFDASARAIATLKSLAPATVAEAVALGFNPKGLSSNRGLLVVHYSSGAVTGGGIVDPGTRHAGLTNFAPCYRIGEFSIGKGPAEGYQIVMIHRAPDMGGAWGGRYADIISYALIKGDAAAVKAAENAVSEEKRNELVTFVTSSSGGYAKTNQIARLRTHLYLDRYDSDLRLASYDAPSEEAFDSFAFTAGLIKPQDFHSYPLAATQGQLYVAPLAGDSKSFTVMFLLEDLIDADSFLTAQLLGKNIASQTQIKVSHYDTDYAKWRMYEYTVTRR